MKIKLKQTKEVDVMLLEVAAKVRDCCYVTVIDGDGNTIHEHDGYVPSFFPEDHYGDYIYFDIDIDTGQILNWKKPTEAQLKEFLEGKENE